MFLKYTCCSFSLEVYSIFFSWHTATYVGHLEKGRGQKKRLRGMSGSFCIFLSSLSEERSPRSWSGDLGGSGGRGMGGGRRSGAMTLRLAGQTHLASTILDPASQNPSFASFPHLLLPKVALNPPPPRFRLCTCLSGCWRRSLFAKPRRKLSNLLYVPATNIGEFQPPFSPGHDQ